MLNTFDGLDFLSLFYALSGDFKHNKWYIR